jgi:hypothetical protein
MLRRHVMIQLKPEFSHGLPLVQLCQAAETALSSAYGVQKVVVQKAVDEETRREWDLCLIVEYVSGVDAARSSGDPVMVAFLERFLASRAQRVWAGNFE